MCVCQILTANGHINLATHSNVRNLKSGSNGLKVGHKICDRICEKGPLGGNVNMWVRVKTHAKSTFHAITDYCIIGTYSVSPTFRPSLRLVLLSCESNEAEQF